MSAALAHGEPSVDLRSTAEQPPVRHWLHVVSHTDPRYGGLSSAVPALAALLGEQKDLSISLAAFCREGEAICPSAMSPADVSFWPASRTGWWKDRQLGRRFAALVGHADALHIHGLWEQSTAAACRLARHLGKPYVLSAHGMLEPWALQAKRRKKQLYAALLERRNVAGAGCLHALTEAEAEQYREFGAKGPIAVVPNAVHVPAETSTEPFLQEVPHLVGKRLVLFLSRFHPKKGLDLLVEAWVSVHRRFPEAHLVLAGPDSDGMQRHLQQMLAERGADETVTFPGMLSGRMKWSALRAAEIFVLPSHSEGLSMALLEAMGMGVPVIATRACHMPSISECHAGWEIEPRVDDIVRALETALTRSPGQNALTGRNGRERITAQYSTAVVVRQMGELYRYVLEQETPRELLLSGGKP